MRPEAERANTANSKHVARYLMVGLLLTDAVMMLIAMWLAAYLRFGNFFPQVAFVAKYHEAFYPQVFPFLLAIWLLVFYAHGLYDVDSLFWGSGELSRIANSVTSGLVILILGGFAVRLVSFSRAWMLLSWPLSFVLVSLGRLAFRSVVLRLQRKGVIARRTLIVGDNEEARALLRRVVNHDGSGLAAVGYVGEGSGTLRGEGISYVGPVSQLRTIVESRQIDKVLVASSAFTHREVAQILQGIRGLPISVSISSGLFEVLTSRVSVGEVAGIPMTSVKGVPLTRGNLATKRAFDLAISIIGLVLLAPVWIALAVLIKLTSPGPVLYRQERVGKKAAPFMMMKFRSMVADADERLSEVADLNEAEGLHFKIRDDPRITRVGRWMRKFSIDEFPQLLNVIRGEMSLVGPRPPLPHEVEQYDEWHRRRLEVRPGITGLWQISGRSDLSFDDCVRLDIYYIENWSPRLDSSILLRTIPVVLFPKGAY